MAYVELAGNVGRWEKHANLGLRLVGGRLGLEKRPRGPIGVPTILDQFLEGLGPVSSSKCRYRAHWIKFLRQISPRFWDRVSIVRERS